MKSFSKTLQHSITNHNSETRLFCAILYQAIDDASYKGIDKKYLRYKQEAIEWLTNMSEDFCVICNLANYNPEYVKDQVKRMALHGSVKFTQKQLDILFDASNTKRTIINLIP